MDNFVYPPSPPARQCLTVVTWDGNQPLLIHNRIPCSKHVPAKQQKPEINLLK